MTYAPRTYRDARALLVDELDMHPGTSAHPNDLDPAEVGIVGGPSHVRAGTSYHLGRSDLKMAKNPYSARLSRDRRGLTDGAAALDIGMFRKVLPGGRVITHRTLFTWLVAQCQAGAPDAAWIREVIGSPDGKTVLRYDRERGQRSAPRAGEADDSHLTHDHVSGYRDEENTPKTPLFARFLREMGDDDLMSALTTAEQRELLAGVRAIRHITNVAGYRIAGLTTGAATVDNKMGNPAEPVWPVVELHRQRLAMEAVLAKVTADDGDVETVLRHVDQIAATLTPPTAEANAEALVRRLGEQGPNEAAASLVAVLGPDRAALLATALAEAAAGDTTAG